MEMIKVLVVEDNEGSWLAAKMSLRKHANCIWAETVAQGLELFEKEDFDIVLLDLHLPEESGLTFAEKVRKGTKLPDIPIFVLSASIQEEQKEEAQKAGCTGFIDKPFLRRELLYCLNRYLPNE